MELMLWIIISIIACIISYLIGGYHSQKLEATLAEKGLATVFNGIVYRCIRLSDYLDYIRLKELHQIYQIVEDKKKSPDSVNENI